MSTCYEYRVDTPYGGCYTIFKLSDKLRDISQAIIIIHK